MKIFVDIIFRLDIKIMYIFLEPEMRLDEFTIENAKKNLIYFFKKKKIKDLIKLKITLVFYIIINLLKIVYFPLILAIYFSRFRFAQINYLQIGALNEHLNYMTKKNYNMGFKTIFLIPKISHFSFVSEIFLNLYIYNNIFLNLVLLPLKHTELISCKMKSVDLFVGENLKIKNNNKASIQNYFSEKNPNSDLFKVNQKFNEEMNEFFKSNFPNINLNNSFVLHHRDSFYKSTSEFRGSDILTYKKMIEFILSKGYSLIRFINSDSIKLIYENPNYLEINTDLEDELEDKFNIKLQYYTIFKSKGLICTTSGPASIGQIFEKSVYDTNNYGPNVNSTTNKGTYILKKIIQNGKQLSLKELINIEFYEGLYLCISECKRMGITVKNNSEDEILEGFKDFLKIQTDQYTTKEQINFKKNLPDIELKNYKSNIAQSFILSNKDLFRGMI